MIVWEHQNSFLIGLLLANDDILFLMKILVKSYLLLMKWILLVQILIKLTLIMIIIFMRMILIQQKALKKRLMKNECLQRGMLQDGGIGACEKMKKKTQIQFLLIKLKSFKSQWNVFGTRRKYTIGTYLSILGQKIIHEVVQSC